MMADVDVQRQFSGLIGILVPYNSAAAGGEEQHESGEPAVEYVEAGVVEKPFHLTAGIHAQSAWPHERGGHGPADARLLRHTISVKCPPARSTVAMPART
jgi:hypothetical protein